MRMLIFVVALLIQFSASACSCRLGTPELDIPDHEQPLFRQMGSHYSG